MDRHIFACVRSKAGLKRQSAKMVANAHPPHIQSFIQDRVLAIFTYLLGALIFALTYLLHINVYVNNSYKQERANKQSTGAIKGLPPF